ncbi:hypothetical protein HOL24_00970 [bacterium]|jgi:hypothetical protein|nr:hypothetical protein [bacterium]
MARYYKVTDGVIIFLMALIARLAYLFIFVEEGHLFTEDQMLFIELVQQFPESGFLGVTPERVPGYPFFVSVIYTLFGEGVWHVILIQIFLDSLSCVVVALMANLLFGKGFWIAGLLSVVNLNMIILSASFLTDTLFLFLFILFLFSLIKYLQNERIEWLFSLIVLISLATLVRVSSYYLLPILLIGLIIWRLWSRDSAFKLVALIVLYLGVSGVILGGIHHRNYQQYESIELVSQTGRHVLGWLVPAVYQYSGQGSYQDGKKLVKERLDLALQKDNLLTLPLNPFEKSAYRANVGKEILLEFGFVRILKAWVVGSVINLMAPSVAFAPALRSIEHPSFYSTKGNGAIDKLFNYVKSSNGSFYLLFLAIGTIASIIFTMSAFLGIFKSASELPHVIITILLLLVSYFLIITGPIIGVKYRLPIEPILTLFATYFLNTVYKNKSH